MQDRVTLSMLGGNTGDEDLARQIVEAQMELRRCQQEERNLRCSEIELRARLRALALKKELLLTGALERTRKRLEMVCDAKTQIVALYGAVNAFQEECRAFKDIRSRLVSSQLDFAEAVGVFSLGLQEHQQRFAQVVALQQRLTEERDRLSQLVVRECGQLRIARERLRKITVRNGAISARYPRVEEQRAQDSASLWVNVVGAIFIVVVVYLVSE